MFRFFAKISGIIILMAAICSCDHEYYGRYSINDCKLKNGNSCSTATGSLVLDWDGTFSLQYNKQRIQGRWDFFDDGEAAILELRCGQLTESCLVGQYGKRIVIELSNPGHIKNDALKSIEFISTSN
jgi:hypothetical protein